MRRINSILRNKFGSIFGLACALLVSLLAGSQLALADTTAMVGVTSDYVDRGISQSADGGAPAVSGGLDYRDDNWYLGIFVSSSEFTNQADSYLGYQHYWSHQFIDVGVIGTWYPQQSDEFQSEDTYEIYAGFGSNLAAGRWDVYLSYDPDFKTIYPELNLSWPLTVGTWTDVSIVTHVGALFLDDDEPAPSANAPEDYIDYYIGITKNGWALLVSDTDLEDDNPRVIIRKRWDWAL